MNFGSVSGRLSTPILQVVVTCVSVTFYKNFFFKYLNEFKIQVIRHLRPERTDNFLYKKMDFFVQTEDMEKKIPKNSLFCYR